jgi:4-amino-4-deoxy-L-arabinose transferase-like glycosyltransferase
MPEARLGPARAAAIAALAAVAMGTWLGGAGRLSYHEAIWAQSAREMIAGGGAIVPTLDGRPWLEKPPLGTWLIAATSWLVGGVGEASARVPSVVAAALLSLAVAALAARRFGAGVGLVAGCVQATTTWMVTRGRLAEADILLAAMIAWAMVALDRIRAEEGGRRWRWAFFALLGATALVKGIGFGAALVGAATVVVLAWDRDAKAARALLWPPGWALATAVALAWPLAALGRYPSALGLWVAHVAGRLAARPEHFAGEPWWLYGSSPLWQTLPWTPLALAGAWRSWGRARREAGGADRLLWAWAVAPSALVSLASVRNAHYLVHALPPWSIWTALALARLGERVREWGWSPAWVRRGAVAGFAAVGVAWALGYGVLGPRLDRRGGEWAFYEAAGRALRPGEPLALLYDDWDRRPYPSPFGPMPHDLAVRLFYLARPACWREDVADLLERPPAPASAAFAVIARDRDVPALVRLGRVEVVARGPMTRRDRAYLLLRVTPGGWRMADSRFEIPK